MLTINCIEMNKVEIGEWLLNEELITDICVAEEQHHPQLDPITGEPSDEEVKLHHHVYMKFSEKVKLDYVRDIILTLTDDIGFDLQPCRSRQNCLKYITKEDGHPFMKNVRVSELAFNARVTHHVKTTYKKVKKIDTADHFMISAGNYRNVAIAFAEKHIGELREKEEKNRITMAPNMQCWLTRAIYNAYLKKDHLYLYGRPGMGKSQLVDRMISQFKCWRAGHADRFMFSELDETHDICLFDDFQPTEYQSHLPRIQAMMDKLPTTVSIKGKPDQTRLIKSQFIFVSNEQIPSSMASLERRVEFFNVDHTMWNCVSCLFYQ
jgi:hypothetical protein